jgi:uncharacterized protein (TIGR02246 family)
MRRPEDVPQAFQTAWNSHDMASLGALFHDDATFVNRFGHYVRGVDAIVALHAPIHSTIYSDSTLENELIDVTAIDDDAAVAHFWSRLTAGAAHPAGPHAVDTLILAVLTRQSVHHFTRTPSEPLIELLTFASPPEDQSLPTSP